MTTRRGFFIAALSSLALALSASIAMAAAPRIINGTETAAFASVGKVMGPDGGLGTGTLIERRKVLTAAHIVDGLVATQVFFVVNAGAGDVTYKVKVIEIHPDFNRAQRTNDLAVLILENEVLETTPSPLHTADPVVGDTLTIVGFGAGGDEIDGQDGTYGTKRSGTTDIEEVATWTFSWTFDDAAEANTTYGDGGGPAFIQVGPTYYLAGIHVSSTNEDSTLGAISTDARVNAYLDWINDPFQDESRLLVYRFSESRQVTVTANRFTITRRGYMVVDPFSNEVVAVGTYRHPITGLQTGFKEIWSLNAAVSIDSVTTRNDAQIAHIAIQALNRQGTQTYWYYLEGRVRQFLAFTPTTASFRGEVLGINEAGKTYVSGRIAARLDRSATLRNEGFSAFRLANMLMDRLRPHLSLCLIPSDYTIAENSSGGSQVGTVARHRSSRGDLVVALASSDVSNATVPGTVTIPNRESSATFPIWSVDDGIADGDAIVTISAEAGDMSASTELFVTDDDTSPSLKLALDEPIIGESAGDHPKTATLTVSITGGALGTDLTVYLLNGDLSEVQAPASVTILAGDTFAQTTIASVDDPFEDGTMSVMLTGIADGYNSGTALVRVTDDEPQSGFVNAGQFFPDQAPAAAADTLTRAINSRQSNTLDQNRVHRLFGRTVQEGSGERTAKSFNGFLIYNGNSGSAQLIYASRGGLLQSVSLNLDYPYYYDYVVSLPIYDRHFIVTADDPDSTTTNRTVLMGQALNGNRVRSFQGNIRYADGLMSSSSTFISREHGSYTRHADTLSFDDAVVFYENLLTDLLNLP